VEPKYSAAVSSELIDAKQRQQRFQMARADDETRLNELLNRQPDEPLNVETSLDLIPLPHGVGDLIERAWSKRQEILQIAL